MLRQRELKKWLEEYYQGPIALQFAVADAEFRRYFRCIAPDGTTYIVMDADPQKMDIMTFIRVRALFSMLHVPQIFAFDRQKGFMLLEDMGETTFLTACLQSTDLAFHHRLLYQAVDELILLQKSSQPNVLPIFDEKTMRDEMALFCDWFCDYELVKPLQPNQKQCWDNLLATLLPALLKQPRVFIHRDYMVRNIMLTDTRPGILDFQDASYGPITYDIVSLLRDAFIQWPDAFILDILTYYWKEAQLAQLPVPASMNEFVRDCEWMSVQRHLKVIGIFARLSHRDGKSHYLGEIRRFLNYLFETTARYKEWMAFRNLLKTLTEDYSPLT